jgi:hypothetical protein
MQVLLLLRAHALGGPRNISVAPRSGNDGSRPDDHILFFDVTVAIDVGRP